MTVSAAMIVKNEERVLARCLDSLQGAVDEIVVVDTGSGDSTKDIARHYTDRVFDYSWRDDFAAARQHAFDRATGDWLFWLDADDVVRNADRIRPTLDATPDSVGVVFWRYIIEHDASGKPTWQLWRERCVRARVGPHWEGRVHETFATSVPCGHMRVPDVIVEHYRLEVRGLEGVQRNLQIMREELDAAGESPSPRLLLHYGRDLATVRQPAEALPYILRYLRLSTHPDELYHGHLHLAGLYTQLQRSDDAVEACLKSLAYHPEWPDAYFRLAELYYYRQDWPKVIHWVQIGRSLAVPDSGAIVNPRAYSYDWIIHYTNALYHVGRVREALRWSQKALAIVPDDSFHLHNQVFFREAIGQTEQRQRRPNTTTLYGR